MAARGDATRDKLLEATTRLVRDLGYTRTTTRAIAQAAGVAEGTLYRHYPDKAGLFHAAIARQSAPATDWVRQLPARAGSGTVAANLTDCLSRLATLRADIVPFELALLTDPEMARPLPQDRPPGPPEFIARYLIAERDLGRLRQDIDPAKTAVLLLAVLFGLAVAPSRTDLPGRPGIEDAVLMIVQGIGPG